jgi:hypothetical protein
VVAATWLLSDGTQLSATSTTDETGLARWALVQDNAWGTLDGSLVDVGQGALSAEAHVEH